MPSNRLELFTRVSFGESEAIKSIYYFAGLASNFSTNYKFWSWPASVSYEYWLLVDFLFRWISFDHLRAWNFYLWKRPSHIYIYMRTVRFGFNLEYVVWSGSYGSFPKKKSARSWAKMTKLSWTVKGNWYQRVENKVINYLKI
jgi:hypothetical protein